MPVMTADLSVDIARKLYIDRWGISTLTDFTTNLYAQFSNKSPQLVYVRAVIDDTNSNWTFSDGTTQADLGSVDAFGTTDKYLTIKRAVPSTDIEDEAFTLKFEFYKDSKYTQLLDTITKAMTANIVDFHSSPSGWTTSIDTFDDGTVQGWSLTNCSIDSSASINGTGYSIYYNGGTKTIAAEKAFTIPSGISKAAVMFYWGAHTYGGYHYSGYSAYFKYVRVYINGTKVYEDYVNAGGGGHHYIGWYQVGIDLSQHAGQDVTIKIELESSVQSYSWCRMAIDDVIFSYK